MSGCSWCNGAGIVSRQAIDENGNACVSFALCSCIRNAMIELMTQVDEMRQVMKDQFDEDGGAELSGGEEFWK